MAAENPPDGNPPTTSQQQEATHIAQDLKWHQNQRNMLSERYNQIRDNTAPPHMQEIINANPERRLQALQLLAEEIEHHDSMVAILRESLKKLGF